MLKLEKILSLRLNGVVVNVLDCDIGVNKFELHFSFGPINLENL